LIFTLSRGERLLWFVKKTTRKGWFLQKFFCAKRESTTFSSVISWVIFSVPFSEVLYLPFSILLVVLFFAEYDQQYACQLWTAVV